MCTVCKSWYYPLTNLSEGYQYPLAPYEKYARGLLIHFPKGCQQPLTHLQEGCPNTIQKGKLFATILQNVKFKAKNQQAAEKYKKD
jgi:hypothetical protein